MRVILVFVVCVLAASSVQGQSLTPRMLGQVSGKREAEPDDFTRAVENKENKSGVTSGAGVGLLSQADIAVDADTTQVGLQAMDLFFNKDWRLYVRSTLPVPEDKPAGDPAPAATLTSSAISGLTDPYGGVLNLSTGAFLQIPSFLTPGHATGKPDSDHGLFLDARFGLKLVNLPDQADNAPSLLNTAATPFYSAAVMFKIVRSLFPNVDGKEAAGGFEFGIGAVVNVAADRSTSRVFADSVLDTTTGAIRCDIAVSLTSVAAIDLSWTPWTSNDAFGKRFAVGLKLLNQNPAVK